MILGVKEKLEFKSVYSLRLIFCSEYSENPKLIPDQIYNHLIDGLEKRENRGATGGRSAAGN